MLLTLQLIDDALDYETDPENLSNIGKPGNGADLRLGLVTAPVLLAAEENPALLPYIQRRFSERDDAKQVSTAQYSRSFRPTLSIR
jgi:hexaprenyl-diphosphate synthase